MAKKETKEESKQLVVVESLGQEALEVPTVIKTEDDAFAATDLILKIRKMFTDLDEKRKQRTAPANETIKLINEDFKKFLNPLKDAEEKLKGAIEGFAGLRIKEDTAKLEQLRAETGDKSLVIPIGLKSIPSDVGEVRFRKAFNLTVVDEKKVPKKYLTVDLKAMQKDVDATEGDIKIPGVEITPGASIAIYTK